VCPKDDLMNVVNYSKNRFMVTVFLRLALVPGLLVILHHRVYQGVMETTGKIHQIKVTASFIVVKSLNVPPEHTLTSYPLVLIHL
jgi:hypothetical protein